MQESVGEQLETAFAPNKEVTLPAAETGVIVSEAMVDTRVTRVEGGAEVKEFIEGFIGKLVGDILEDKIETEAVPLEKDGTGPNLKPGVEEGGTGGDIVNCVDVENGDSVHVDSDDGKTISSVDGDRNDSDIDQVDFLKRMEEIQKSNVVIQEQINCLTQMLGVLQTTASPHMSPDQNTKESIDETTPMVAEIEQVGDVIAHAALISSLDDEEIMVEELHQPCNSAEVDDSEVVVVGEIISRDLIHSKIATADVSHDTFLQRRDQQSEEAKVVVSEPSCAASDEQSLTNDMPSLHQPKHKGPKLQLAATFKHSLTNQQATSTSEAL